MKKRAEIAERFLAQLGHLQHAGQRIVAIDLHQRIDVEEDGGNAGEEHRLVGKVVQHGVGIRQQPGDRRR